ncbi:MAG: oxidoreductase [Pseudorhodoplanes sp.]|nr:Pyrogallol hydroxytransferase small subunit [Pseudorhodoplanes sp.]MBW7949432.1 oxidoreductase [Pseudorhodoplanes sp.]
MTQYRMLIDVSRCIGCYNCYLACRDEHVGRDHRPLSAPQPESGHKWMAIREEERGTYPKVKMAHIPVPCQQCAEAPCIKAASDGAVYRRGDGIVVIDPDKASGQRALVEACPYGAIFWNEALSVPQKCTFCAHLLDSGWKEPRCVEVCPTQALVFADADDRGSAVVKPDSVRSAETLHPEFGMKPLVEYMNLPKPCLVGEVSFGDQVQVPAEDISVFLRRGDHVRIAVTDCFGDFEFDNLEAGAEYQLKIEQVGYRAHELRLRMQTDLDLGTIILDR